MNSRAYLSIGDVLTLLRQEFPDVTISKIRFLESQGLVNPERTPSGYRKFYEQDVDRLRWVLRQQREHFLPLKVIKGRLEEGGTESEVEEGGGVLVAEQLRPTAGQPLPGFEPPAVPADVPTMRDAAPAAAASSAAVPADASGAGSRRAAAERRGPAAASGSGPQARGVGGSAPDPGASAAEPASSPEVGSPSPSASASATRARRNNGPASAASPVAPSGRAAGSVARPAPMPAPVLDGDMTVDELVTASGCTPALLAELESYGLVAGRQVAGTVYYDEEALAVAKLAVGFAAFGVEARHLRLHKHAAEREGGFVAQVVLPLLKQRNPESRQRAHDTVDELSRLGQELRAVMLRKALRDQLGG
ncbi:MAG TPA: MerR family transcriptional regulator [Acidimicrobiales bacterium]|nr:MerR family transcriptional regulator [Acidimicrobiales bacterium]